MPQTKNADGFLHQRLYVPFTRRQALPALQRLTRNVVALPGLRPLPALQRLTRDKVALHARRALHVRRTLHGASRLHPIHQPSHSFIEGSRFHVAQLGDTLQYLVGVTVVVHPSDDIVYSRGIHESDEHNNKELYCSIGTQLIADKPTEDIQSIQENYTRRSTHMREAYLYEQMMQVRLVCMERRYALHDSSCHYAKRIKNRN